ncbi:MAG TPA: hypothetical protein VFR41_15615, partial [Acidimicrobiia bacterium]|nr:hypothetical protein [Acidimicrobiia bacterium]
YGCFIFTCGWGEERIPESITNADPAIAAYGPGKLVVAARRADGHVYLASQTCGSLGCNWGAVGHVWTDMSSDGTRTMILTSAPELASFGASVDSFAILGRGTDNKLWLRQYCGGCGGWGVWRSAGGIDIAGGVGATLESTGSLAIAARGTDNRLYLTHFACALGCGFAQAGWQDLGGLTTYCNCLDGDPDIASSGPGRLDIVIADQSRDLQWKPFRNGTWLPGFMDLGGKVDVNPALVSQAPGQLAIIDSRGQNLDFSVKTYSEP